MGTQTIEALGQQMNALRGHEIQITIPTHVRAVQIKPYTKTATLESVSLIGDSKSLFVARVVMGGETKLLGRDTLITATSIPDPDKDKVPSRPTRRGRR